MDKQRLLELAGMPITQNEQLNEELKPANGKEFTQKDWDEHIGHIVDIILHMAKADVHEGEDVEDVALSYLDDATHDIKATITQRIPR